MEAYRTQPQVHIGMCAIPQLDPSTEATTFMNACIYYQVHCSIDIVFNRNSPYVAGEPCTLPYNALWTAEKTKYYGHPTEMIGIDTHKGIFTHSNLDRFADLAADVDSNHISERIERLRLRNRPISGEEQQIEMNDDYVIL